MQALASAVGVGWSGVGVCWRGHGLHRDRVSEDLKNGKEGTHRTGIRVALDSRTVP